MKIYWTTLFMLISFFAFAQPPTGDIEKDTALANQYFEEALNLYDINNSNLKIIDLLEKADTLYEAHPFCKKLIEIKGLRAASVAAQYNLSSAEKIAKSTIELAEKKIPDELSDPSLFYAYYAMQMVFDNRDDNQGIEYGMKAKACVAKTSYKYFYVTERIIGSLGAIMNLPLIDTLITDLKQIVSENTDLEAYQLFIYSSQMTYDYRNRNFEKAIINGQKLFADNEKFKLLLPNELFDKYVLVGQSYAALRNYDKAIEWMNTGFEQIEHKKNAPAIGNFYVNLAGFYKQKGDYKLAIENYEKANSIYAQKSEVSQRALMVINFNISVIYIELKEYDKAEEKLRISKKHQPTYIHDFQLGKILSKKGQFEEGLVEMQKAIVQNCTEFNDTNIYSLPSLYEVPRNERYAIDFLYAKSIMWYDWGRKEKDIAKIEEGLKTAALVLKMREVVWQKAKGYEQSKFAINVNIINTLNLMMKLEHGVYELVPSDIIFDKFLTILEKRKSKQLIETLTPSLLTPALADEEQELVRLIQYNGQQLDISRNKEQKDSIDFYQEKLFDASQKMENYTEKISKLYPKRVNHFYDLKYAASTDIQKELAEETVFVEYIYNRKELFAVTIGNLEKKIIRTDISNLNKNIKKLNELIQDPFAFQKPVRDEFIEVSHELYKTLIQPIEAELEGKTKLMIVVERQLFHLPFELLLKSNEKKPYNELDFLIKKYEVNYHYSATAFLKLKEKQTIKDNSLLAFAPIFAKGDELNEATRSLDFMVDSVYRSIENFEFIALPNTKKEINTISKLVKSNNGQANILLAKNATKDKLSQQLEKQSYQFIHIATHGLVNFKNPRLSALACYVKDETMDNLMYANEIQFKDINADLVVLSSCESGIGQLVQGEGLIALNRSFIYSGAKNVMFSLWKVSDKYSSELMIDFYKSYFENQNYTSALRQAKLKMLENPTSAQPKYWSAFVLMGE